jgi:hypothetical protein
VVTHLKQMQQEGRLRVRAGKPRQVDPVKAQREREQAKERAAIIKQAEKLREQERQARLRAQETPPNEQWAVPPTYELTAKD